MVEPPIESHWNISDDYNYFKTSRDNKLFFISDSKYGEIVVKYPTKGVHKLFYELRVFKQLLTTERSPYICYPLFVNNTNYKALVFPNCGKPLAKVWRKLSKSQLLQVFIDIISALKTIHNSGIIYFDLHDLNVLVTEKNRGILIDFDSSEFEDEKKYPLNPNETFERYPLEAWSTQYDCSIDIHCFGHLLKRYIPEMTILSEMCMHSNPTKRPSLNYIQKRLERVEIF